MPEPKTQAIDFAHMPGHMVRKLHQVQVALFMKHAGDIDLPPVQFAALAYAQAHPGTDQASLARAVAYDPVTVGGVLLRLEKKAWIERRAFAGDKRVKCIHITTSGESVLADIQQRVEAAQLALLRPLTSAQQKSFVQSMAILLEAHGKLLP